MQHSAPHSGGWYVVYSEPLRELRAAAGLESIEGVRVFLPEIRRMVRGQVQRSAFFPRYLFVHANFHVTATSKICATPGVHHIVCTNGTPDEVDADVIELLRDRLDSINARGGLAPHGHQTGDTVRLRSGPLRGIEAVFQGPMEPSTRVRVLLEFLGRPQEVEVAVDAIEPIAPRPAMQRTSRGRGRPIRLRPADAPTGGS